ncbi:hypothetical protein GCM10022252_07490 [Streptosporangium oxazolinicum]|uniref:Adhesin domain-containing protein n=1 Tax=Streptosporangium oxazolinicum TaxID=909287 RepID=A0ABP8ADV3_9ACTN
MPIRNNARIAWLIAGGTLTALVVAFTALAVWVEIMTVRRSMETTMQSRALTAPGIVVETTGYVNVSVVPGAPKRLDLERTLFWTLDRPVVTEEWDGRTLRLDVRCLGGDGPGGPACQTDYILRVPAATDVEAVSRRLGTVSVSGIQGDLDLSTTAGDVIVDGTGGALRVRAQTGNVIGTGLGTTGADVETGTGDVELGFTAPPGNVNAVVRAAGNVRVMVPDGEQYQDGYDVRTGTGNPEGRDVRTGTGNAIVEVRRDPAAPRRITALTGMGELSILPSRTAASHPASPMSPATPESPESPESPENPASPATPENPASPESPASPARPASSVNSTSPAWAP